MSGKEMKAITKSPLFHKGMIVRIKLTNFMTYDKVELHSQPKLNFIIGPNGTGKSAFLCAVVLGLGGKCSIIGRSTNVSNYIKRGHNESKIEIELFNPDGVNFVITRLITSTSSSTWQLQGKTASFKQISDVIEKLNIQINNLCMILPQDRVQDFTKMNKKQLLEHTQKSVGTGGMAELFEKLCQIRNNIREQNDLLKEKTQRHENELQLLKRMEVDVKSYRERQDTINNIEMLKKKEAWLTYEEKSSLLAELKEESNKIRAEYEKARESLKPFLDVVKEGQKKELALHNKIKTQNKIVSQSKTKQTELKKQYLILKNKIVSRKDELKEQIEAEKRRESEISCVKDQIKALEDAAPKNSENVLNQNIKTVEKELESLLKQISQMRLQENEIRSSNAMINQHLRATEHKINQAQSVNDKKLALLQNYKDVHEAYNWLSENRHIFSGNVYGPLFIEINVKDSNNAKYVEKVIPPKDLIAFACETSQDTTKLLKLLRDEKHLKINVINTPPPEKDIKEQFVPPVPITTLKKYGFHSYLIDLIEGPPSVLNFLCSQLGFHKIPLGSDEVLLHMDEMPASIKLFFTKEKVFQTRVSHYSGERVQTVREVLEAKFLEYSINHELIGTLTRQKATHEIEQREGKQREIEVNETKKKLEVDVNHVRNTKREFSRELEYLKNFNVSLRMKREELTKLQQITFDKEAEELRIKEQISEFVNEMMEVNVAYFNAINDYHKSHVSMNLLQLELDTIVSEIEKDKSELRNQEAQILKITEKVEKMKSEIVKAKTETKFFYDKAKEMTDGLDPDNPKFVEKYQQPFKKFPNRLQDLKEHLGHCEAMLRCQQNSISDKVVRDYDEKKYLLSQLGKDLERVRTNLSVAQQESKELRNKWLPQITDLVSVINDKFSRSFSFLGCAGGIELDQGENLEEYENYGINVKVKFRNDVDMLTLNPFTQSGGEKALSIAVYLLSLQSVISVPFRWVDEINQGMDEYNEVHVYFLMMCEIANDPAAQYFIITPKLVPGIKMSTETTVHVIYSGEFQKKGDNNDAESEVRPVKIRKVSSKNLKWSKQKYFEYLGIEND